MDMLRATTSVFVRGGAFLKSEWRALSRFVLVGGSSFVVRASMYALISRVLWVDGPRWIENIFALLVAMVYNYAMHRVWTFRHQRAAAGSGVRYTIVTVIASILDATFFYVGHSLFHIYDFVVLVLNGMTIAFFTYVGHKLFTFHDNPWKRKTV